MNEFSYFKNIIETAMSSNEDSHEYVVEDILPISSDNGLSNKIEDVIVRLRAYNHSENHNDFGSGYEQGCEMAAEMLENVLRQWGEDN